jgi:hypothetical protein
MTMTGSMRKRNCLRYQVLHSTHCFKPIISIVSRIRLSFSTTSSCSNVINIFMTLVHLTAARIMISTFTKNPAENINATTTRRAKLLDKVVKKISSK